MSNTSNHIVDNVMSYTSYRIPIYGNLIKPSNGEGTEYQSYHPVIATNDGSCLAVDYNRVYVPIKVPTDCATLRYVRYSDKGNDYTLESSPGR